MNFRRIALILAILGIGVGTASFGIEAQNIGSCPLATTSTPPCDHTFPGTSIYIGQTANELGIVAFLLLVSSMGVALYGSIKRKALP